MGTGVDAGFFFGGLNGLELQRDRLLLGSDGSPLVVGNVQRLVLALAVLGVAEAEDCSAGIVGSGSSFLVLTGTALADVDRNLDVHGHWLL